MNPAFNLVPPTAETQSGLSERPLISNGLLVLSNGMFFRGKIHGPFQATGELIFNTSMSGYQEILSDPSYSGQIVTMTAPHIGNYGTNPEDMESSGIHASALVVTQLSRTPSNWRSKKSLPEFLMEHRVPVMEGVDTRALVRVLRSDGEVKGLMVP